MTVGSYCSRQIDTATAAEPVITAARRMHQRRVGSLIIVDDGGEPIGIVTDRDLVTRVMAASLDPVAVRVGDVMTRHPESVMESASSSEVLKVMARSGVRRLAVTDLSGRITGIVSLDDVLGRVAAELDLVRRVVAPERAEAEARS